MRKMSPLPSKGRVGGLADQLAGPGSGRISWKTWLHQPIRSRRNNMDEDYFDSYEPYEPSPYNGDDLDGGYHDGHWENEAEPWEDDLYEEDEG